MTKGNHKEGKKCSECEEWHFGNTEKGFVDIQFPIKHKGCKGLIHLDKEVFADGYSSDINLIFTCYKCGKELHEWSEGETFDNYFKKVFGFVPKKRRLFK